MSRRQQLIDALLKDANNYRRWSRECDNVEEARDMDEIADRLHERIAHLETTAND
jgi:hypothetical protein